MIVKRSAGASSLSKPREGLDRAYEALVVSAGLLALSAAVYVAGRGFTLFRAAMMLGLATIAVGAWLARRYLGRRVKIAIVYPIYLLASIEVLLQALALMGLLPRMNVNDMTPYGRVYQNLEGFANGVRNRHGWFSQRADFNPGAHGILLVGDSFIDAVYVQKRDHIATVLERSLAASAPTIELTAIGRAGFGPAQYLELARDGLERLNPAEIAVFLFLGNDLRSVMIEEELAAKPNHTPDRWIYYQRGTKGVLELHPDSVVAAARLRSKLDQQHQGLFFNLPRTVASHYFTGAIVRQLSRAWEPSAQPSDDTGGSLGRGLSDLYFRVPSSALADEAITRVAELLERARQLAAGRGAELRVISIPHFPPGFFAAYQGEGWSGSLPTLGLDLLLPERRLGEALAERGIEMLEGGRAMQTAGLTAEEVAALYLAGGSGHFSTAGHHWFAEIIARRWYPERLQGSAAH